MAQVAEQMTNKIDTKGAANRKLSAMNDHTRIKNARYEQVECRKLRQSRSIQAEMRRQHYPFPEKNR